MKNVFKVAVLSSALVSGSVFAMGATLEQGKSWTGIEGDIGKDTSGIYLDGNWRKNTDDGSQTGGVGAGYNLGLGPVMVNAGAKALYIEPRKGDSGVVFPVGLGVKVDLPFGLGLYGEGYSAADGMGNSVKNYTETNAGISWSPISLVTLKAGYRYAGVDGKKGRPDHTIYDGMYVSAGASF